VAIKDKDGYRIFDPNVGEYSGIDSIEKLNETLKEYLAQTYQERFTSYEMIHMDPILETQLPVIANKHLYQFVQDITTKPASQVDLSPDKIDKLPSNVVANIGTLLSTNELRKRVLFESKLGNNALAVCSILQVAMAQNDVEITKLAKAKLDTIPPKDLAIQDSLDHTPLIQAICDGHLDLAKILISKMDPKDLAIQDSLGYTPLIQAIWGGHLDLAKLLISKMDPKDLRKQDTQGKTAVIYAIEKGQTDLAKLLINQMNPQDLGAQDQSQYTALMWALYQGMHDVAQDLIEKMDQKDLNKEDTEGKTAVIYAIETGQKDLAKLLTDKMNPEDLDKTLAKISKFNFDAAGEETKKMLVGHIESKKAKPIIPEIPNKQEPEILEKSPAPPQDQENLQTAENASDFKDQKDLNSLNDIVSDLNRTINGEPSPTPSNSKSKLITPDPNNSSKQR